MATLYILHSTNLDKFYIGHTEGTMEERLKKHLANHNGFTSKAKDWKIVYREEYSTKKEAYQRELQIIPIIIIKYSKQFYYFRLVNADIA